MITLQKLGESPKQLTPADIYAAVGERVVNKWVALGDMDTKIHWAYGAAADELIPEFPAMVVYKAIALKVGRSSDTIRQAYYTFKAFTPATREIYDACPYSVFLHARKQKNPVEVLEEYIRHPSIDYIEKQFPSTDDPAFEDEFSKQSLPRMFYSIFREVFGTKQFTRALELMKELSDIVKQVNK